VPNEKSYCFEPKVKLHRIVPRLRNEYFLNGGHNAFLDDLSASLLDGILIIQRKDGRSINQIFLHRSVMNEYLCLWISIHLGLKVIKVSTQRVAKVVQFKKEEGKSALSV
jgi:hypothetical protein